MDSLDYWRLCDTLNVVQAALLIAGCDPAQDAATVEDLKMHQRPAGYEAAKTAILHALGKGRIVGTVVWEKEYDFNGNHCGDIEGKFDPELCTVDVDSLRAWLKDRGFTTGFFFPKGADTPDYLDPKHPRYAPKLAAAVNAWLAVDEHASTPPKRALDKWLRIHAAAYGLTKDDGNPNETGIDEIAKVANWQPGGGAPKTPGA